MDDKDFLKLAIGQSELAVQERKFPAGSLVVLGGKILSQEIGDFYPSYKHSESKAIDIAFMKYGRLADATLYASMEPCIMCIARAYWAGIRRIIYAINRDSVNSQYYEGLYKNHEIIKTFHESIEYFQIEGLEKEALNIVREWEEKSK